ncbi:hypothetical protein ACNKHV_15735 [Shigella flexneri]
MKGNEARFELYSHCCRKQLQGFSPASVCIVGTHTLRQALNATDFLKHAEKVHSLPD